MAAAATTGMARRAEMVCLLVRHHNDITLHSHSRGLGLEARIGDDVDGMPSQKERGTPMRKVVGRPAAFDGLATPFAAFLARRPCLLRPPLSSSFSFLLGRGRPKRVGEVADERWGGERRPTLSRGQGSICTSASAVSASTKPVVALARLPPPFSPAVTLTRRHPCLFPPPVVRRSRWQSSVGLADYLPFSPRVASRLSPIYHQWPPSLKKRREENKREK
uniref:Uncharacterized protein n=1 Tax=Oryza punctata TaxID=4537 RepID=A0A0E0JRS5_ORYPU